MEFEALDMFRKSALCIHANNSIWPMRGGILTFNLTWVDLAFHCIKGFRLPSTAHIPDGSRLECLMVILTFAHDCTLSVLRICMHTVHRHARISRCPDSSRVGLACPAPPAAPSPPLRPGPDCHTCRQCAHLLGLYVGIGAGAVFVSDTEAARRAVCHSPDPPARPGSTGHTRTRRSAFVAARSLCTLHTYNTVCMYSIRRGSRGWALGRAPTPGGGVSPY